VTVPFRIWVDADAMPGEIKEIVLRASRRLQIETVLVANKNVATGDDPLVSLVRVDAGPDVADAYIVDNSAPADFCITADIPLAARLVDRGLTVIDPRGELYSAESIGERLAIRDFMAGLRASGVQTGGPAPFSPRAKQKFAALFDRLLTEAVRSRS
jgi:uncharacterized protein YaiI (UPF0178 family)